MYINQIVDVSGTPTPIYYDTVDAEGADKKSHCIVIEGTWPFLKYFTLNASVDLRYVINANHVEGRKTFETIFKTGVLFEI